MKTGHTRFPDAAVRSRQGLRVIGPGLWIVFGLGPLVAIALSATQSDVGFGEVAPNMRRFGLLLTSLSLGAAVAVFTTVLAVLAAYKARSWAGRPLGLIAWLPVTLIAVPPYVHANAWMAVGDGINRAFGGGALPVFEVSSWFATFWVQSMAFLPITFGFALLGIARVEPALGDAGRLHGDATRVFARIILPLAAPVILVGSGLVFVLSLTDFGTAALFQLSSYAMEIFVTYSAGTDARSTLVLSLPLVVICVAVIAGLLGSIETGARRPDTAGYTASGCQSEAGWFRMLQSLAVAGLGLQMLVPLAALLYEIGSFAVFAETVGMARGDVLSSAASAAGAAAVTMGLAVCCFIGCITSAGCSSASCRLRSLELSSVSG